jgi:hypothetical protein
MQHKHGDHIRQVARFHRWTNGIPHQRIDMRRRSSVGVDSYACGPLIPLLEAPPSAL